MEYVLYLRCSTSQQNEQRQREIINNSPYQNKITKEFVDFASGGTTERPQFEAMHAYLRSGDVLVATEAARLSRNTRDLLNFIALLDERGITLVLVKEGIDTSSKDTHSRFLLQILASVAEIEHSFIKQRTQDTATAIKRRGGYTHKSPVTYSEFTAFLQMYKSREISKRKMAELANVSRPTLQRLLISYETSVNNGANPLSNEPLITFPMSEYQKLH